MPNLALSLLLNKFTEKKLRRRKFPSNALALWGYWASPIQKVVKKWRNEIGEDWCKQYLSACVRSVDPHQGMVNVKLAAPGHLGYVLDLLQAADEVFNNNARLDKHLLALVAVGELFDPVTHQPCARSVDTLRKMIHQSSGIWFEKSTISQRERRLRLNYAEGYKMSFG